MPFEFEDQIERSAVFSNCRIYCYTLERYWNKTKPFLLYVLLNPSIADEYGDDPTNVRGIQRAYDLGYGGCVFCNAFAYVTSDPEIMKYVKNPVGPDNDKWILKMAQRAGKIVLAWGNDGSHMNRDVQVHRLLIDFDLYHLRKTNTGQPWHLLYLPLNLKPIKWQPTLKEIDNETDNIS